MKPLGILSSLLVISSTAGEAPSSAPGCAISCWENTKYVSKCLHDIACLCTESSYQNSVYQCIYSQCDAVHFGSALHHVISQCFGIDNRVTPGVPPVANHDELRRRESEYLNGPKLAGSGSGSAFQYPTDSASFPTQSAPLLLESVGMPYPPSVTTSLPPYFPLNFPTSSAIGAAKQTETAAVVVSTTAGPLLFTGYSPHLTPSTTVAVLSTLISLYSAL